MSNTLPPEFSDLEPFADWAIPTERARYDKRYDTPMSELQAFYDAAMPRLDAALDHLDQFDLEEMPEDELHLLWLCCALCTVSFPVECWAQPRVPDSGAATFDAYLEPAI